MTEQQPQLPGTKQTTTSFAADQMDKETANFMRWAIDSSDFITQLKAVLSGFEFERYDSDSNLVFRQVLDKPLINNVGIHSLITRLQPLGKELRLTILDENQISTMMKKNIIQLSRSLTVSQTKFGIADGDDARTIFTSVSVFIVSSVARAYNDSLWKNIRETTSVKEEKSISTAEKKGVGLFGK